MDNSMDKQKKTVLIAEDDETSFFFLKFLLTKENINVLYAQSGQEAVDLCETHPEIDLILMDIKMAGMSGIEATQKIKAKYPDHIVIAQTAFALTSDKENILKAGCDDYITKPIRKEELLEKINYYLYSKK
ncbi:MAG: response regulator [Bacteroidales bacterium]|nr:response regulator [Bacteroidales bacterium]